MTRHQWIAAVAAIALSWSITSPSIAQVTPIPKDVLNPKSDDGIPELLTGVNSIIRPQDIAVLQFDSLLDPSNGADPTRLTAAALSIQRNHQVAQQQVELAIRYLLANRNDIVAGNNAEFNRIFGKAERKQKVAILAPVSLPGTFTLASPTLLQARSQGGGGGGGQNRPQVSVANQLRAGDSIFLVDPTSVAGGRQQGQGNNNFTRVTYPDLTTTGFVVKIAAVIPGGINQQGGGGGGGNQNQNQNTDFILDPTGTNVPANQRLNNVTGWRVVRFAEVDDPSVYNQVLATFMAIRDALAGFDPSLGRSTQTANTITYHRRFRDINAEYRVGDGILTGNLASLNGLIDTPGVIPGRGADFLVRYAGFSKSDSYFHLDRQEDIGNGIALDRLGRPTTPLLWTEDNTLPLVFNTRVIDPNATDENRSFFHNRQTIFGGRDDPFNQYLARGFLEEKIFFDGDFFDTNVASTTPLQLGIRDQRSPAGGAFVTQGGGNSPVTRVQELAQIPETGTPNETATLRKWQMIISSFAEWNTDQRKTDLTNTQVTNIAARGLLDMLSGVATPTIRAHDADNYAKFADLIRATGGGVIDFSRVEPIGKRGNAGFNPVVPVN